MFLVWTCGCMVVVVCVGVCCSNEHISFPFLTTYTRTFTCIHTHIHTHTHTPPSPYTHTQHQQEQTFTFLGVILLNFDGEAFDFRVNVLLEHLRSDHRAKTTLTHELHPLVHLASFTQREFIVEAMVWIRHGHVCVLLLLLVVCGILSLLVLRLRIETTFGPLAVTEREHL
jgi:hypothetical protein